MTRDEILQHARPLGLVKTNPGQAVEVVALARAIEAQVREECAKVAEAVGQSQLGMRLHAGTISEACAQAIRAMPQTEKLTCCKGGPQWGHAYDCWMLP